MFGRDPKWALYDITYRNAMMYSRAMPMMGDDKQEEGQPEFDATIDACDPRNFGKFAGKVTR